MVVVHRLFSSLLVVLLLVGCGSPPPAMRPLAANAVILAFGDSITHGTGATASEAYPAVLAELIQRQVINAGVPGEVTAGGLERLPSVLEEFQPELVVLCLGGNDMLRKRGVGQAKENLRRMVLTIRASGSEVVLLGVPKPALFGLESAEFYSELAEELAVPFEGAIIPEVLGDRDTRSDAIHPNADGYRMIAEAIADLLRESGALPHE